MKAHYLVIPPPKKLLFIQPAVTPQVFSSLRATQEELWVASR